MIDKFSNEELKHLVKLHTGTLFNWASNFQGCVSPQLKEALLHTTSRLYEVIEALPKKGPNVSDKSILN